MTNSGTDIDVLTNFQPMPKRFMVWDKENKKFLTIFDDDGLECAKFGIHELYLVIEENGVTWDEVIIVQSTNLFDKDGKEISEGTIVDDSQGDIGVIEFKNSQWAINWQSDEFVNYRFEQIDADSCKCVGHILSNPELLEEK